ncbi:hypothetical protein F2Q69_00022545 [Brassica cretica]|uniref:Uncharacterized protein n=1 Tax=Brassica cretica TaxID=69181 RepID=A0A8S9QG67_BRACR|nr:hypothetical protein F2Q69_00022545 [Brassica cretica]
MTNNDSQIELRQRKQRQSRVDPKLTRFRQLLISGELVKGRVSPDQRASKARAFPPGRGRQLELISPRTHPARIFPSSRHMPEPEASPSLIKAEEKKSSVRTRLGVKIAPFHNLRFIFVHRQQIQDLAKLSRDQVFSFVEMARLLEIKPSDLTRCVLQRYLSTVLLQVQGWTTTSSFFSSGGGGGFDIELLQTHENRWTQRLSRLLLARHLITKESTAITEEERSSSSSSLHGKHALNISKLRVDHGYNLRSEKGLFVLNSLNSSTTSHSSFLALHAADSHDSTTHLHKITSSHRRCFDHVKLGPRQRRFVKTISASRLTSTRLLLIKARDFIMGSFRLHMDHNNTAKRRPSTAIRLLRFFHGGTFISMSTATRLWQFVDRHFICGDSFGWFITLSSQIVRATIPGGPIGITKIDLVSLYELGGLTVGGGS